MKILEIITNSKVIKESKNARQVNVLLGDEYELKVWFPKSKSIITEDGMVAVEDWLIDAKSEKLSHGRLSYVARIQTLDVAIAG